MNFRFLQQLMNWVDLLAVLPYYLGLLISIFKDPSDDVESVAKIFKLLRIVKIARSVRIFKLARHFEGLQALGYTFSAKRNEFGLLLMFLTMGAVCFSSLVYLAEKDSGELVLHPDGRKKQIEHMMDAYWWSFITMTTVNHLKQ